MNSSGGHGYGYVMKTKCPQGTVKPQIQTLCETVDNTDFLRSMPVVDEQGAVVYRNVFCARCNSVRSVSYWRMTADCGRIPASALPQESALLLAFIRENCTVNYNPTDSQQKYLKKCLAAESNCPSNQIVDKVPVLEELCSYYALPVCGDKKRKNPHCALCNGKDITQINCGCPTAQIPFTTPGSTNPTQTTTKSPPHTTKPGAATDQHETTAPKTTKPQHLTEPGTTSPPFSTSPGWTSPPHPTTPEWTTPTHSTTPGVEPTWATTMALTVEMTSNPPVTQPPLPPPLNILFDFSSNKMSIQGKTTKTKVLEQRNCQEGFVYDPFVKKCREAFRKVIVNSNSSINSTNSTSGTVTMINCSGIQLNASDIVLYPNGTLWVPLYAKEYNRTDYFMNGSSVFLCTDFARNYSHRETIAKWSYVLSPLQILTYVGSSVSILSLLILLVIYCVFKELRTLPGKNLMNLSFAMIFYHIFLFVAGFRNIQVLCTAIAILLHYFLLCSFAWMSIMAFDVVKTFVFNGKKYILELFLVLQVKDYGSLLPVQDL